MADTRPKHKPNEKHTLDEVLKSLQDLVRNDVLDKPGAQSAAPAPVAKPTPVAAKKADMRDIIGTLEALLADDPKPAAKPAPIPTRQDYPAPKPAASKPIAAKKLDTPSPSAQGDLAMSAALDALNALRDDADTAPKAKSAKPAAKKSTAPPPAPSDDKPIVAAALDALDALSDDAFDIPSLDDKSKKPAAGSGDDEEFSVDEITFEEPSLDPEELVRLTSQKERTKESGAAEPKTVAEATPPAIDVAEELWTPEMEAAFGADTPAAATPTAKAGAAPKPEPKAGAKPETKPAPKQEAKPETKPERKKLAAATTTPAVAPGFESNSSNSVEFTPSAKAAPTPPKTPVTSAAPAPASTNTVDFTPSAKTASPAKPAAAAPTAKPATPAAAPAAAGNSIDFTPSKPAVTSKPEPKPAIKNTAAQPASPSAAAKPAAKTPPAPTPAKAPTANTDETFIDLGSSDAAPSAKTIDNDKTVTALAPPSLIANAVGLDADIPVSKVIKEAIEEDTAELAAETASATDSFKAEPPRDEPEPLIEALADALEFDSPRPKSLEKQIEEASSLEDLTPPIPEEEHISIGGRKEPTFSLDEMNETPEPPTDEPTLEVGSLGGAVELDAAVDDLNAALDVGDAPIADAAETTETAEAAIESEFSEPQFDESAAEEISAAPPPDTGGMEIEEVAAAAPPEEVIELTAEAAPVETGETIEAADVALESPAETPAAEKLELTFEPEPAPEPEPAVEPAPVLELAPTPAVAEPKKAPPAKPKPAAAPKPAAEKPAAPKPAAKPAAPKPAAPTADDIPVLEDVAVAPAPKPTAKPAPKPAAPTAPVAVPPAVREMAVKAVAKLNIELRKSGKPPLDAKTINRLQQLLGETMLQKDKK